MSPHGGNNPLIKRGRALTSVAPLLGALSCNLKITGSIVGSNPSPGAHGRHLIGVLFHTDVYLSPFLSL